MEAVPAIRNGVSAGRPSARTWGISGRRPDRDTPSSSREAPGSAAAAVRAPGPVRSPPQRLAAPRRREVPESSSVGRPPLCREILGIRPREPQGSARKRGFVGRVLAQGDNKMVKRVAMAVPMAAVLVMSIGGTAFAGEVTGNGESTPIREWRAASVCSFSGLNDTYSGDPDVPDHEGFTRTQNWGQLPNSLRQLVRDGESPDPHLVPPNVACNPGQGSR